MRASTVPKAIEQLRSGLVVGHAALGRFGQGRGSVAQQVHDGHTTTVDQQSDQFATSFARSVTDRTVDRIVSRLRTSLVVRTESETEETNVHGLTGPQTEPFRGIYHCRQDLRGQLFDIGARAVADFDIPEPGAFLIRQHLPQLDEAERIPTPPRLADHVSSLVHPFLVGDR